MYHYKDPAAAVVSSGRGRRCEILVLHFMSILFIIIVLRENVHRNRPPSSSGFEKRASDTTEPRRVDGRAATELLNDPKKL